MGVDSLLWTAPHARWSAIRRRASCRLKLERNWNDYTSVVNPVARRAASKEHNTLAVERHIEMTKMTMAKTRAEALRFGIEVEGEELVAEACMAQNTTLSYGGYTPSMAVFGILPRS